MVVLFAMKMARAKREYAGFSAVCRPDMEGCRKPPYDALALILFA